MLGIIPARYGSTRLEGKPLAEIARKPMVQHVYERARKVLEHVVVATDDQRIIDAVQNFGGQAIMTSPLHSTGTNRCLEAYEKYVKNVAWTPDVIINIQGDEPMLDPNSLVLLRNAFKDDKVEMASLASEVTNRQDLKNNGAVFCVIDQKGDALYFSRSPIPYVRDIPIDEWLKHFKFHKHIGMYAFLPRALREFSAMPMSSLEKAESLEQNRWLENGRKIRIAITQHEGISVDTVSDLERVRKVI